MQEGEQSEGFRLPEFVNIRGRMLKVTYRSDKVDLEKAIRNDWELRRIFKYNVSAWGHLNQIMDDAVNTNSFCVFQYKSMSNGGKSWAAIQVARILRDKWRKKFGKSKNPRILFAHFWGHVMQVVDEKKASVSDHVICDEESTQSGEHAITDAGGMSNILRSTREEGICYSFLDPEEKPKPNVDAVLWIIGIIKDAWISWILVLSPKGTPVGLLYLKIPGKYKLLGFDEDGKEIRHYLDKDWREIMAVYEPSKRANIKAIIKSRGLVGSDLSAMKEDHARELYNYAMKQGLKPTARRLHNWLGKLGKSKLPWQTRMGIIQECKDIVAREGIRLMMASRDKRGVNWDIDEVKTIPIDNTTLLEPVGKKKIPILVRHLEAERVKYNKETKEGRKKPIPKEHIEWFRLWCLGASQQAVADQIKGANQVKVGRAVGRVRLTILGYAVERWVAEKYPKWIHKGGNSPEPDFENDTHVISVKGRCRHNPQWSINSFGIEERNRALETGKELQLWYFELRYEPRLVILRATPIKEKEEKEND